MTLGKAIKDFQIYSIIQKVKNKKGKIEEIEVTMDDLNDGLNTEGRITIRNVPIYTTLGCDRLVFLINEVVENV